MLCIFLPHTQNHFAEGKKPDRRGYILYGHLHGISEHVKLSKNDRNHMNGSSGWRRKKGTDYKISQRTFKVTLHLPKLTEIYT